MDAPKATTQRSHGFEVGLLILSAVLAAGFLGVKSSMGFLLDDWKVYLLIATFAILTYLSHHGMRKSIDGRPAQFANRFMGSILLKLLVGFLLFIIIALSSVQVEVLPFGICFLVVYLVYTIYGSQQAMCLKNGSSSEK